MFILGKKNILDISFQPIFCLTLSFSCVRVIWWNGWVMPWGYLSRYFSFPGLMAWQGEGQGASLHWVSGSQLLNEGLGLMTPKITPCSQG